MAGYVDREVLESFASITATWPPCMPEIDYSDYITPQIYPGFKNPTSTPTPSM
jgi:hypothetical protein